MENQPLNNPTANYGWYLPTLISNWLEASSNSVAVDPLSHLVALNRPEAVAEVEPIDIDALMLLLTEDDDDLFESDDEVLPLSFEVMEAMDIPDVPAIPLVAEPARRRKQSRSNNIIDRFLEVKELKIVVPSSDSADLSEPIIDISDTEQAFEIDDALVNEKLALIHLSQKNYEAAKDIYTKLFLHYSEKSAYFAKQIKTLPQGGPVKGGGDE